MITGKIRLYLGKIYLIAQYFILIVIGLFLRAIRRRAIGRWIRARFLR